MRCPECDCEMELKECWNGIDEFQGVVESYYQCPNCENREDE